MPSGIGNRHHALTRRTLAFLIAHRKESEHCSRRLPDHRLAGRSPLYLHHLLEVLLLIEEPMSRFVTTVGTSREQLRAVDPLALEEAE